MTVQVLVLLAAGLGTGYLLDVWRGHEFPTVFALALFGSGISYIYSAPPLKLKQWGWAGNFALGSSYIALPWWAGQVRGKARQLYVGLDGSCCLTDYWRWQSVNWESLSPLFERCIMRLIPSIINLIDWISNLTSLHPPPCTSKALFGELSLDVCVLTVLYSIAGLGIAIVNDFKSIEGDRYRKGCHF